MRKIIFGILFFVVVLVGVGYTADKNDMPDLSGVKPPDLSDVPGYNEYLKTIEEGKKKYQEAMKALKEKEAIKTEEKKVGSETKQMIQPHQVQKIHSKAERLSPPVSGGRRQAEGSGTQGGQNNSILLLKPEEIEKIKQKALEYRRVMEKEAIPSGIIRDLFVDDRHVYTIRTQVNYSTVIRFPEEEKITLSDVVGNSERFVIDEYEKGNALLIFPIAPFKATNMTVFVGGKAYHFLLVEEMDTRQCDFRVDVHYATEDMITITEILRMLIKEYIPDTPEVRYAGVRMLSPLCKDNNSVCKNVVAILDIERPSMRAYKIRDKERKIQPFGAAYQTRHDGFLYVVYSGSRGRVKVDGKITEIER